MKRVPEILALASSLIGATVAAHAGTAGQPLPTPFPEVRYQSMSSRSPFAVASATADAKAAPTPGFAAQLYVDGVAHIGQCDYVAIKSRDPDQQAPLFLQVGEVSKDGIKVERVEWSDVMGKSTVEVSKGEEKAKLEFDQAQIAKAPTPQATGALAGGMPPGMVHMPGGRPMRVAPGYHPRPGMPVPKIYQLHDE